jgi:hypothetical protein
MSANPADIMQAMAAQNPDMAAAMRQPPPNSPDRKQTPALDNVGLDLFRPHMTEVAFDVFITIVHWCIMQQKLSDGESLEYSNEVFASMAAATRGFGNSFIWENEYKNSIGKHLDLFHMNWYMGGVKFRRDNPLPHKIIRELAPAFANTSKGWKNAEMIRDLIDDPNTYKDL